jgi:tripartite-type tricarboxylate transporter receptor subunit TctC
VRVVVTFPPGGGTDLVARFFAAKLSELNQRQFVVDNRPGANGSIGTLAAARSPADGYTMLISSNGALIGNPRIYSDAGYTAEQFDPVARLVGFRHVIIVNPRLNLASVAELIALARSRPGGLNYGSGGIGNGGHLVGELFRARANVPMTHVPFRGGALAMNALIAGDIDLIFSTTPEALPQINARLVQVLATIGETRLASLPDVPALREAGLAVPELAPWMCFVMPRGVPPGIVAQINRQVNEILAMDETRATFAGLGLLPLGGSPEDLRRRLGEEVPLWEEVIAASGARADASGAPR